MVEVLQALRRHAQSRSGDTAFADDSRAASYGLLLQEVEDLAARLAPLPQTLGLLCRASVEWVVIDLAATLAGKTLVPLPDFFSAEQLGHILRDAAVGAVVVGTGYEPHAAALGIPWTRPHSLPHPVRQTVPQSAGLHKIVYTSGSSGRPKGVRLGERQIGWSARALAEASGATAADRYLSLLPHALLLEQICAIHVPLLTGAPTTIAAGAFAAALAGDTVGLARTIAAARPTATVLVPDLLDGWVRAVEAGAATVPPALRFVAVGGAPVPGVLAERAWAAGIPVHEGYGLTEGCSVVAVNRPGRRKAGTVGTVLPGTQVLIDDGEIVVRGPGLMEGYLGGPALTDDWRTGDLGSIDSDGYLRVHGRRDALLVTAQGRNISPEWVEATILSDPGIAQCVVIGHGAPILTAVVVPSQAEARWFASSPASSVQHRLDAVCRPLPDYARPRRHVVVSPERLHAAGCLTGNGRPIRNRIVAFMMEQETLA